MVFSLLIAMMAHKVAAVFAQVGRAERWARFATGGIFLAVGVYFTMAFTLGIL